MNVAQFKDELKKVYAKYFNGSALRIESTHGIYRNIVIQCFLIKDSTEAINRIAMNDMFRISFSITHNGNEFSRDEYIKNNEMTLPEDLRMEKYANSYFIKPESHYYAYSQKSIAYRQTQGNARKIIDTFEKFIQKLSKQLHDDLENGLIHDNHIELLKKRLI